MLSPGRGIFPGGNVPSPAFGIMYLYLKVFVFIFIRHEKLTRRIITKKTKFKIAVYFFKASKSAAVHDRPHISAYSVGSTKKNFLCLHV